MGTEHSEPSPKTKVTAYRNLPGRICGLSVVVSEAVFPGPISRRSSTDCVHPHFEGAVSRCPTSAESVLQSFPGFGPFFMPQKTQKTPGYFG